MTGAPGSRVLAGDVLGGPRLALVHGLEDGWESWQPLVRRLGPGWRVDALDLPWRAGGDYGWRLGARPADWVARGLAALDGPADVLVGHSYGAAAILELLARGAVPRPPAAAVLVAPFYRPADLPVSWDVFDRSRTNFDEQIRDGVRMRLGRRGRVVDPEVLESMMAKTVDRVGPAGFLAVFDQFVATGTLSLAHVAVPTLVLAGRRDPSLGRRRAAALAAAMPAATVVLEDDWDHFCHVRRSREVADRIAGFLAAAGIRPTAPDLARRRA